MGVMFLRPTDESLDANHFAVVGDHGSMIAAKHLMHFTGDEQQIGLRHVLDKGCEF